MTLNERKILNIWGKKYLTESAALLCFNIYIFNMVTIGNLVNLFYVMFMRERFIFLQIYIYIYSLCQKHFDKLVRTAF